MDFSSCLVLSTRGVKARHRHLLRDLMRLLPHSKLSSKLDTDNGLQPIAQLCEDHDCGTAILLDARDPRRLFMWVASCPDGPSAMFRMLNIHTVAELKLDARRVVGARNLLIFDSSFAAAAERRVMRALLTRAFAVPRPKRAAGGRQPAVRHALSFSWVDGSIWMRVFRIDASEVEQGGTELNEIGPRLVLRPTRVISGGFEGSILSAS